MAAAAHDPKFAAKVKIPVQVAKEFNRADTGRKILTVKHKTK
jgi:ribosome assembly protein YihI (activator of Der GTPase)